MKDGQEDLDKVKITNQLSEFNGKCIFIDGIYIKQQGVLKIGDLTIKCFYNDKNDIDYDKEMKFTEGSNIYKGIFEKDTFNFITGLYIKKWVHNNETRFTYVNGVPQYENVTIIKDDYTFTLNIS